MWKHTDNPELTPIYQEKVHIWAGQAKAWNFWNVIFEARIRNSGPIRKTFITEHFAWNSRKILAGPKILKRDDACSGKKVNQHDLKTCQLSLFSCEHTTFFFLQKVKLPGLGVIQLSSLLDFPDTKGLIPICRPKFHLPCKTWMRTAQMLDHKYMLILHNRRQSQHPPTPCAITTNLRMWYMTLTVIQNDTQHHSSELTIIGVATVPQARCFRGVIIQHCPPKIPVTDVYFYEELYISHFNSISKVQALMVSMISSLHFASILVNVWICHVHERAVQFRVHWI